MKIKTTWFTAALPILALLSVGLAAPAQAVSPQSPTASELDRVRATMTSVGIDSSTQDSLIAKLQAHQPLDSMIGATPVRTYAEDLATSTRTVKVFADGSRSWVDLEKAAEAGVSTRSAMTNCATSGVWRVNCRIDISDLVSSAWFVIDYKAAAPSQLRDFRGKGCQILGGTCNVNGKIERATQNSAGPAWAYLNYNVSTWTWIGASGQFGIRVSNGSVSTY